MKKNLIKNLSINTMQLFINQVFALLIFYVLSTQLSKTSFGHINLVLAILMAAFNVLALGIDQLTVKKIAAGDDPHAMLTLYCFHVLLSGVVFYAVMALGYWLFPHLIVPYKILVLIGIGKLMLYFANPFKQVANGLERFRLIATVSVVSNITRGLALVVFALLHKVNLQTVIIIFIAGDTAEFAFSVLFFIKQTRITPSAKFTFSAYGALLKAAFPQAGVVIITAALSRFDWIFIGLYASASNLAEYSFAYRVYELSSAPLLALAPLLIPRFTKMIKDDSFSISQSNLLIRIEMVIASLSILVLNVCWSPVIDGLTSGKYGSVNQHTIFILSLSTPVIYLNNFFWTMYFAQGRLKMILHSFIIAVGVNILLDVVLIPLYKNEGAALAVLLALTAQYAFFVSKNTFKQLSRSVYTFLICTGCAVLSAWGAQQIFSSVLISLPVALLLFTILLLVSRQINLNDRHKLFVFLK